MAEIEIAEDRSTQIVYRFIQWELFEFCRHVGDFTREIEVD